jgi:hypothetical protein
MKCSRIALFAFAAAVGVASLLAPAPFNSASAGGLGLDWLSNKPYVDCLKLMDSWSRTGGFSGRPARNPAIQSARFDQGRRACNKQYYGHE